MARRTRSSPDPGGGLVSSLGSMGSGRALSLRRMIACCVLFSLVLVAWPARAGDTLQPQGGEGLEGEDQALAAQDAKTENVSLAAPGEPAVQFNWQLVERVGPKKTGGESLVPFQTKLVLFGGCYVGLACYNYVYMFDTAGKTMTKAMHTGTIPSPRGFHSASAIGDLMYVFGGSDADGLYRNDVFAFNMTSLVWKQPQTKGTVPVARKGHTGVAFGENLFIFGGLTADGFVNSLHVLNTRTMTWSHPRSICTVPPQRAFHSAVLYQQRMVIIGGVSDLGEDGGLYSVDLRGRKTDPDHPEDLQRDVKFCFEKIASAGPGPTPRHGHASAVHGSLVYVIGGCDYAKQTCFNDTFVLDLEPPVNSTLKVAQWARLDVVSEDKVAAPGASGGNVTSKAGVNGTAENAPSANETMPDSTGVVDDETIAKLEKMPIKGLHVSKPINESSSEDDVQASSADAANATLVAETQRKRPEAEEAKNEASQQSKGKRGKKGGKGSSFVEFGAYLHIGSPDGADNGGGDGDEGDGDGSAGGDEDGDGDGDGNGGAQGGNKEGGDAAAAAMKPWHLPPGEGLSAVYPENGTELFVFPGCFLEQECALPMMLVLNVPATYRPPYDPFAISDTNSDETQGMANPNARDESNSLPTLKEAKKRRMNSGPPARPTDATTQSAEFGSDKNNNKKNKKGGGNKKGANNKNSSKGKNKGGSAKGQKRSGQSGSKQTVAKNRRQKKRQGQDKEESSFIQSRETTSPDVQKRLQALIARLQPDERQTLKQALGANSSPRFMEARQAAAPSAEERHDEALGSEPAVTVNSIADLDVVHDTSAPSDTPAVSPAVAEADAEATLPLSSKSSADKSAPAARMHALERETRRRARRASGSSSSSSATASTGASKSEEGDELFGVSDKDLAANTDHMVRRFFVPVVIVIVLALACAAYSMCGQERKTSSEGRTSRLRTNAA